MEFSNWTENLGEVIGKLISFAPVLLGAVLLVLVGFLLARLLDKLFSRLLARIGLDRLMADTGLPLLLRRAGFRIAISGLIGKVIYWFVLLSFLVSAAELLELERVSAMLDLLALFLPKVFLAGLVLMVGILLAQVAGGLARGAAEGVGMDHAGSIGRIAQGLVIVISISVAISQMEVKTDLLNLVIAIVLTSVGLALALAFGLGSREVVSQIIAGIYVRELYEVGQDVRIGELEGIIEEIGTVKTVLLTDDDELITVCNRDLLSSRVLSR